MKKILSTILLCALASYAGAQVNYRLDAGVATNPTRAGLIVLPGGSNNYQALYTQNLLASVGSLNGINQHLVLTAAGGSNTTATLNWPYANEAANYYAGQSLYVACHYSGGGCTGGAQGQTVTVLSSTVPISGASFTATGGAGNSFTVAGVTGTIALGAYVPSQAGIPNFTQIVSQTSGTPGGAGVYVTSQPTSISNGAATTAATGPVLTFATLPGGAAIGTNDTLYATAPEASVLNTIWQQKYNYGAPAGQFTADTNPAHQPSALYGLPAPDQSLAITLASASDSAQLQVSIDNSPGVF